MRILEFYIGDMVQAIINDEVQRVRVVGRHMLTLPRLYEVEDFRGKRTRTTAVHPLTESAALAI